MPSPHPVTAQQVAIMATLYGATNEVDATTALVRCAKDGVWRHHSTLFHKGTHSGIHKVILGFIVRTLRKVELLINVEDTFNSTRPEDISMS